MPARLIKLPPHLGAAEGLFELFVSAQLHPQEKDEIEARFGVLGSKEGGGQLWLTVKDPAGVEAWDLSGQVLERTVADRDLRAVIVDRESPAVRLSELVIRLAPPTPGGKEFAEQGYGVDLVLPTGSVSNPLFNRILGGLEPLTPGEPQRPPLCILKSAFTSRVSTSTDRLLERFELTYDPSPLNAPPNRPVVGHLGDFNKLRLALSSQDPEVIARAPKLTDSGRFVRFLTYPDAAVPLPIRDYQATRPPWQVAAPPQPGRVFGYFLSHLFTQDARGEGRDTESEKFVTESLRYIIYMTPQLPWSLDGYVEHQYTQRFPLTTPKVLLPLATDIQSPATAALRVDDMDVALIGWRFNLSPASFELNFSRKYLAKVLAPADNGEVRPAALRAIYEPLADLIAAIDRGAVELVLQRWAFDPDGPRRERTDPPATVAGTITERMVKVGLHKRPLKPVDAGAAFQFLRNLLRQPLEKFESAVQVLAGGAGDKPWLEITISCPDGWSDLTSAMIVADESDVLRLGLRLSRPADAVLPGSIVDPTHPEATPGFGLEVDKKEVTTYPELKDETFADLHDAAALELATYVSATAKTALRERFDWLRAIQPLPSSAPPPQTDPEQTKDPRRLERLFGASLPFLFAPATQRPAVERVLDLYYVPFAFLPLRPHKDIGDAETTLEFAEFLSEILNDIASGAPVRNIVIDDLGPADAFGLRNMVRTLLPEVAGRMAALVANVHNPNPAGASDDLFKHVNTLATQVSLDLSRVLEGMLTAAPGLFATTKGFGVAIFESAAWSPRLHSLQVKKWIHPALGPDDEDASRVDVDQFPFPQFQNASGPRYIVDVLDDARYDNEFEIDQSIFDPPRAPWTEGGPGVVLGSNGAKLRHRGGVQARSGEDVIEQNNRFDDGKDSPRQIEADAVHWNLNWTRVEKGNSRRFYLLPSRRRPATPIKLKPRASAGAPSFKLPLCLRRPLRSINKQLTTLIDDRLRQNNVIEFGSGDSALTAKRRTPTALVGTIQPGKDGLAGPGWWHFESYASEHYFVLEGDEESSGPEGPFGNDRIRIEVEIGEVPFIDEDPTPPKPYSVEGKLGEWFGYQRLRAADPNGVVPKPGNVSRKELEDGLRYWLAPATSPDDGLLVPAPPVANADKQSKLEILNTKLAAKFKPGKPGEAQRLENAEPQGIGSVLAAEIMDLDASPKPKDRFILRVVVLDEPWRYTRVRVRIERNMAEINDDELPDINPSFQMIGDFSCWSSHGREPQSIDMLQNQALGLPDHAVTVTPIIKLDAFLKASVTEFLDYGDRIGAAIDATFVDPRFGNLPLWNPERVRLGQYGVTGMIVQHRPDLHPRYAIGELTDQLESRTEEIPRVYLAPLAADPQFKTRDFSPLLKGFTRTDVPSPHHAVQINWTNEAGDVLVTCMWPVRFQT